MRFRDVYNLLIEKGEISTITDFAEKLGYYRSTIKNVLKSRHRYQKNQLKTHDAITQVYINA